MYMMLLFGRHGIKIALDCFRIFFAALPCLTAAKTNYLNQRFFSREPIPIANFSLHSRPLSRLLSPDALLRLGPELLIAVSPIISLSSFSVAFYAFVPPLDYLPVHHPSCIFCLLPLGSDIEHLMIRRS